jgi:hypothetical protein
MRTGRGPEALESPLGVVSAAQPPQETLRVVDVGPDGYLGLVTRLAQFSFVASELLEELVQGPVGGHDRDGATPGKRSRAHLLCTSYGRQPSATVHSGHIPHERLTSSVVVVQRQPITPRSIRRMEWCAAPSERQEPMVGPLRPPVRGATMVAKPRRTGSFVAGRHRPGDDLTCGNGREWTSGNAHKPPWQCGGQGFESPQLHRHGQAVLPPGGRPESSLEPPWWPANGPPSVGQQCRPECAGEAEKGDALASTVPLPAATGRPDHRQVPPSARFPG